MSKKTTGIIVEKKCDYVIGVKQNQPTLYRQIQSVFKKEDSIVSSMAETIRNKGRAESRQVRVSEAVCQMDKAWQALCQVIELERYTKNKGKTITATSYYISNKRTNAWEYLEGIRNHWGIEMGLHYVKDVTLKEDSSKITTANAPSNISMLKSIAINIIRSAGYKNITVGLRSFCNDIAKMLANLII